MMVSNAGASGRTALITGASSGIGYELAKLFARDKFDLVLVARDTERLERVAEELKQGFAVTATVVACDLSKPGAAARVHQALQERGIEIEVLVNNAGFNVYGPFWETDAQSELDMIGTNIVALTELTKLLLPAMMRRGSGRILNLGSTASFVPGPLNAVYCASKAYVLSLSEALAEELRGSGVSVTALCPGATRTDFASRAHMTDTHLFRRKALSATEVAEAGYRGLMDGRPLVVVGLANRLMVLSLRFAPREAVARSVKRMMGRGDRAPTQA